MMCGIERLDALEAVAVRAIQATYDVAKYDMTARFWIQKGIEGMRLAVADEHAPAEDALREVARLLDRSTQTGKAPTTDEWAALTLANATLDRLGGQ